MTETQNIKKVVLVAEDEADIRDALVTALETLGGFSVVAVEDGGAALERILADRPDHVILDIHMPVMNGDAVLEQVRADAWGKNVPVTILTAQSDMIAIANAIEVGGAGTSYLIKSDLSLAKVVNHVAANL